MFNRFLQTRWLLLAGLTLVLGFTLAPYLKPVGAQPGQAEASSVIPVKPAKEVFPYSIKKDSTLFETLLPLGLSPQDIHALVKAAKPHRDLSRIRPGIRFQAYNHLTPALTPTRLKFRLSALDFLELEKNDLGEWDARPTKKKVDIEIVTFKGRVMSSLWSSAEAAQMDPSLIAELTEIFAWQIDFSREVRSSDRWRLSVEKKIADGEFVGWGRILAAEYINAGTEHKAALFVHDGEEKGYYAPDGSNMRRMFLKSPIRFARISSRFQRRRFHPVLKRNRPHLGVDYAAATGTPIRAVGDGSLIVIGRRGGAGNMIKIRHNSVYQTAYMHLSRFAKGLRRGSRVKQGQIIGYVGSTGLSTGPHLHFEFFKHGRYMDPLKVKFPSADPVPESLMAQFEKQSQESLSTLPDWVEQPRLSLVDLEFLDGDELSLLKKVTF